MSDRPGQIDASGGLMPEQRERCVRQLRLIWAALLVGLVVMAVVLQNVLQRAGGGLPTVPAWLGWVPICLLYTSPSPRDKRQSRMPSSA